MSYSIFNKLASSRRILSTTFTVPHDVSSFLVSSSKQKISFRVTTQLKYTLENEPRPPDNVLLAALYQPAGRGGHQDIVGQNWSKTKAFQMWKFVDDIIRKDYLEKYIGLDTLHSDDVLWKLLTSDQRLKDLGVFYKPAPIPNKNEWRASWCQKGKPNWLGTIPTKVDSYLCYIAIVYGFFDEERGKGGYAITLIDNYSRPKVAAVGYSPKGHSLFLFELQGIRAALQLALDYGFGANIEVTTRSEKVWNLFYLIYDFEDLNFCEWKFSRVCLACLGLHLYKHFIITELEDFHLLYPVIKEILELRIKFGHCADILENLSQASVYLGKCYGTPTTEK
ncbi:hypothetical protein MKX01_007103 [Papaver californicum]|nr:hypothetical protein MKX01_007103 [Papaver californicum]